MRINLLLSTIFLLFSQMASAQSNFWQETAESAISSQRTALEYQQPKSIKYFQLDLDNLKQVLKDAPHEQDKNGNQVVVSFPLADGHVEDFIVVESPVMAPGLAAKYPSIKTYSGLSIDNPLHSIRFDYSPRGFSASIHTPEGKTYIDPYTIGKGDFCVVYNADDMGPLNEDIISGTGCGVSAEFLAENSTIAKANEQAHANLRSANAPVEVIVYKLALACVGEFGDRFGRIPLGSNNPPTKENVNAQFATALNRLNQIYLLEFAVRMELIELNDNLIFLDGSTDPYLNPEDGSGLLGQNAPAFISSGIPTNTYDVGHVFTNGCDNGLGGVVNGRACTDGKMRGVTCWRTSNVEVSVAGIMAHEIGHQFTCGHSWDNCPNSADQRSGGNAYEPGSGTTIMSYSGTCGNQNITGGGRGDYFNIGSLESFFNYARGVVPECGTIEENGNNEPVVSIPIEGGFIIPGGTPFDITAEGTDIDGDQILYCWEQHDLGGFPSTIGEPVGNAPLFRSWPPTPNPTRTFPRLSSILNSTSDFNEVLPTYDRELSFAITLRDGVTDGSGVVWDFIDFEVDADSGPFLMTFPNTFGDRLTAGATNEITWDVAGTFDAPINAKTVDIFLSYDDAVTFDTLATGVINDGSYLVDIPEQTSNTARVKVKASDNIFFDISGRRVEIEPASAPGYTFNVTPELQEVCAPANVSLDVITSSVLGFEDAVEVSIVSDLPDYILFTNINNTSLTPGEATTIDLEIDEPGANELLSLTIRAISANADTTFRTVEFNVLSNDFSTLTLDGPIDGESGILTPDFVWSANSTALTYTFELATSPTFSPESMIEVSENQTENTFSLSQILEPSTLFYWRITPFGLCGAGEPTIPAAFHTASFNCNELDGEDLPIAISANFSGDLSSKINVSTEGTVSDINIKNLRGNHSDLGDLSFAIISPSGTRVDLVRNKCLFQSNSFDMGFDQDSPFDFACPPRNIFIPEGDLNELTGESIQGIWELVINDRSAQFGGTIESWSLEFCSSVALSAPELVRNNTLDISANFEKPITNNLLRVEDNNNELWELIYTVVTTPEYGQILNNGTALQVGDNFNQFDINNGNVTFSTGDVVGETDNFLFTVVDGEGGWTGTHSFNVNFVDVGVSAQDLAQLEISVFPNPVNEQLTVKTNSLFATNGSMEVYNLQGQLIVAQKISGNVQETINTSNFTNGIYFLRIQDGTQSSITKFVVERN